MSINCLEVAARSLAAVTANGAPRRGAYRDVLSSREFEFLMALFALSSLPNTPCVQRWSEAADISPSRLRKFFENQRNTAKHKGRGAKRKADEEATNCGQQRQRRTRSRAHPPLQFQQLLDCETSAAPTAFAQSMHQRLQCMNLSAAAGASAASFPPLLYPLADVFLAAHEAAAAPVQASITHQETAPPSSSSSTETFCSAGATALDGDGELELNARICAVSSGPPPSSELTQSAVRLNVSTLSRLETLIQWLDARRIDPYSCVRACATEQLAQLVTLVGMHKVRRSLVTGFCFASACLLRTAFEQCAVPMPASLPDWKNLLSDAATSARVSRMSDSLLHHVRRVGPDFSASLPAKAREGSITTLALISAVAPQDCTMHELVRHTQLQLQRHQASLRRLRAHVAHNLLTSTAACVCVRMCGVWPDTRVRSGASPWSICPPAAWWAPSTRRPSSASRRSSAAAASRCWRRCTRPTRCTE